jgi:nucleotide-binding universal stress UspA family protein
MFRTLLHPTDFDEPSREAFRVARSLAQALGARLVVFHVVPPPAIVTQDGRVVREPYRGEPVDLWADYRTLLAEGPAAPVEFAVVVGDRSEARRLLVEKVRELGEGSLVVMGTHGSRGLSRLLWGSAAEEIVRDCPCPVMVVKAPCPMKPGREPEAEAAATL